MLKLSNEMKQYLKTKNHDYVMKCINQKKERDNIYGMSFCNRFTRVNKCLSR